jgi:hypothetical protein
LCLVPCACVLSAGLRSGCASNLSPFRSEAFKQRCRAFPLGAVITV